MSYQQKREEMRRCRFTPYLSGHGPSFTLSLYWRGTERIGYRLTQSGEKKPIFEGQDFRPSPMHSVDGDEAVKALMGFLTLRPGDTDREYFDDYTPRQLEFAAQHAEALACCVYDRFGE